MTTNIEDVAAADLTASVCMVIERALGALARRMVTVPGLDQPDAELHPKSQRMVKETANEMVEALVAALPALPDPGSAAVRAVARGCAEYILRLEAKDFAREACDSARRATEQVGQAPSPDGRL